MCRNIKTLYNFSPPATDDEIRASALQFVRKLSGMNAPSQANAAAFNRAVEQVAAAAEDLLLFAGDHGPAARPRHRGGEGESPLRDALRRAVNHRRRSWKSSRYWVMQA